VTPVSMTGTQGKSGPVKVPGGGRIVPRSAPGTVPPVMPIPPAGATATPTPARTAPRSLIPKPSGTYVAETFTGELNTTTGTMPALARDGEPAGLARVTMAMRSPVRKDSPAPRRLIGLNVWAAALGILGAVLAIRCGIGVLAGAPRWFFPTASLIGVVGVALTMGAFVTARMRNVPWALLGLSTAALIGAFAASLIAL